MSVHRRKGLFAMVARKPMTAFTAGERKAAEAQITARETAVRREVARGVDHLFPMEVAHLNRKLGGLRYLRRYLRRGARR